MRIYIAIAFLMSALMAVASLPGCKQSVKEEARGLIATLAQITVPDAQDWNAYAGDLDTVDPKESADLERFKLSHTLGLNKLALSMSNLNGASSEGFHELTIAMIREEVETSQMRSENFKALVPSLKSKTGKDYTDKFAKHQAVLDQTVALLQKAALLLPAQPATAPPK